MHILDLNTEFVLVFIARENLQWSVSLLSRPDESKLYNIRNDEQYFNEQ